MRQHRPRDQVYRRLDEICEFAPIGGEPEDLVFWFVELVRWLRGHGPEAKRGLRLRYLRSQLANHADWHANVSRCLTELITRWDVEQLLAYGGIPRDFHFTGAVREWLAHWVLPAACSTTDAVQVLALAFDEKDTTWLTEHDVGSLAHTLIDRTLVPELDRSLSEALLELANLVTVQANAPSVRGLSNVERSPFRGLTDAVVTYLATNRAERKPQRLHGRIQQCLALLEAQRNELAVRGADLNTTFQLARISQQLVRAQLVAALLCDASEACVGKACVQLVRAVTRNTSGRRLLARSSSLVVQNLVDSAAEVGHDYLAAQSSWRAAFFSGFGGGALMAGATLSKYWLADLHLSTFYEGVVFSLNYALVFSIAYLLHFSIATKLPAHTAAALAKSVHGDDGHSARLQRFAKIWRATVRMQLAGLLGNLVAAAPLAFAVDVFYVRATGHHFFDQHTAVHVLDANSLLGPSPLYAALTGLLLWLSSLLGAAADNWTRVTHLLARLSTNLRVMRSIGPARARPLAARVVAKVGGLASNVSLGLMLGGIPAGFAILAIPIEIRHVTVSTSSVALAYASGVGNGAQLAWALTGVLLIGVVNVAVSFALALRLALGSVTARGNNRSARALVRLAIRRWLRGQSKRGRPERQPPVVGPVENGAA